MMLLSEKDLGRMLNDETPKAEDTKTILRAIYVRYMRLYEKYLDSLDALNDEEIAEMRKYHEETASLVRYYYMDIPEDVCGKIRDFDEKIGSKLLGEDWRKTIAWSYQKFAEKSANKGKGEKFLKAEFVRQARNYFYDVMDYVFRDGFGTGSQSARDMMTGLRGLLFGKDNK